MDAIKWILFESPIGLGVVGGAALFALLVYWRRSLKPRPLLIGVAVTIVLFIVQGVVVTLRERVFEIMRPVERGIMDSDVDPVGRALAASFAAGGRDRSAFLDYVDAQFPRVAVHMVRLGQVWIEESSENRFVATLAYAADVTVGDYTGRLPTVWEITYIKDGEVWKIERIEPKKVGLMDMADWRQFEQL